jgi:hypothetical protein
MLIKEIEEKDLRKTMKEIIEVITEEEEEDNNEDSIKLKNNKKQETMKFSKLKNISHAKNILQKRVTY